MSLAFLNRSRGSKKGADSPGGGENSAPEPKAARGAPGGANIRVGGSPRVDLMPPEIRLKRSQLRTRRSLRLALVGVFAVVVVACGATWALATVAQTNLSAAQAQQQQLIAAQSSYSDVTKTKSSIALIEAGQRVGDSSEIDWDSYLTQLQAALPAGVTLSTVTITSATPITAFEQSATPLEGSRIATLDFTATSPTLPSVPTLLNGLKSLPGFVDATPGSVSLTSANVYTSNIEMHIGTQAFTNRFDAAAAAANKKAIEASKAATSTTGGN